MRVIKDGTQTVGKTPLQLFSELCGLKIVTIKVRCPECQHEWGIGVDWFPSSVDIPQQRLTCKCGYCVTNGVEARDLPITLPGGGEANVHTRVELVRRMNVT